MPSPPRSGPERDVVIARELTKRFETIIAILWPTLRVACRRTNRKRGEFVLIVEPPLELPPGDRRPTTLCFRRCSRSCRLRSAVRIAVAPPGQAEKPSVPARACAEEGLRKRRDEIGDRRERRCGWSRCGECPQSASSTRSTRPPTWRSMASSCAGVPYSSSRPWISSSGQARPAGSARCSSRETRARARCRSSRETPSRGRRGSGRAWSRRSVVSYHLCARAILAIDSPRRRHAARVQPARVPGELVRRRESARSTRRRCDRSERVDDAERVEQRREASPSPRRACSADTAAATRAVERP